MPRQTKPGGVQQMPLQFPMGGLSTVTGFAGQPPDTTPDCLNVMPFDPGSGRGRGGQRAGVSRVQTAYAPGFPVQMLMQADLTQLTPPGLTGFQPTGSNLETTMNWNSAFGGSAFNALEAGTPWIAWGDDTKVANVIFADNTATQDSTNFALSNAQVFGTSADFLNAVFLACGSTVTGATRSISARREGSTAPAGAWGPTYCASLLCDVTQGWSVDPVANSRAYLVFVGDGGGTSPGKVGAGIALRDNQYLEFVTVADNAAPVVASTIDLVQQFNEIYPSAPGGPLTALSSAGFTFVTVTLCKQTATSGNTYLASVSVTLDSQQYTWTVLSSFTDQTVATLTTAEQGGVQDSIVFALDCPGTLMDGYFQLSTVQQATIGSTISTGYGRLIELVEVQGGNLYSGQLGALAESTGGNGIFNPYLIPSACYGQGQAFIVDGTNTWCLTLSTNTVAAFTAGSGLGTLPAGCRIAVMWRDRLVLCNQAGSEQDIYASRQGVYNDWNYGQPDAQSAWALNASNIGGHVGQPVYCFAPCSDDVALIGCSSSTYKMSGDPASGGTITNLSTSVGVFGQNSWAMSPKGVVYFVGTGGFYRWHTAMSGLYGEMAFENLSDKKCPQFFQQLNRATQNVFVEWDRDKHGCWIFVCPTNFAPGKCLWFDELSESFWPMEFPAGIAPTAVEEIDADAATGVTARCVLLGGADGYLRKVDYASLTDDGTGISSYIHIGPRPLADAFHQGIIQSMEFILAGDLGAAPINLAWSLQVADSPEGAYDAASMVTQGTFTTGGRQPKSLQRARGNAVDLYLSNAAAGSTWAFERAALTVMYGGMNR